MPTATKKRPAKVVMYCGDSRKVLKKLQADSIDACITDPPYSLVSIIKRFGKKGSAPAINKLYASAFAGFMGQTWDTGEVAFDPNFWQQVLRVLKPGGHIIAMGGTRTFHRLACAIEDAGFEIRDTIMWVYGSGFPKSRNIGNGWGTSLKPSVEPCVLARKPLSEKTVAANVLKWGTGALNIDGCRVEGDPIVYANGGGGNKNDTNRMMGRNIENDQNFRAKPWINTKGRWPANLIHDGSEEVVAAFPDGGGGAKPNDSDGLIHGGAAGGKSHQGFDDSGSAARFFYTAKADFDSRLGSKHPTVKPVALFQYFCKLICPRGGTILDPFAGTGTAGEAATREGMKAVLIEREPEYQADIRRRFVSLARGPWERQAMKTRHRKRNTPPRIDEFLFERE